MKGDYKNKLASKIAARYQDLEERIMQDIVRRIMKAGEIILDWDTVDIGSRPLLLPPGEHTLGIVTSTFSQIPEVTITYRERWL